MSPTVHKVARLALPRVIAMDFSIGAHVLGRCPTFEVMTVGQGSVSGPPVDPRDYPTDGGAVVASHPLSAVDDADIVVVPGFDDPYRDPPRAFLHAIARASDRGATMVGVCTGTFALAAGGVTVGRKVTTHWHHTARLRELYPGTTVVDNVLYVADGNVLTSAGAGAGIDMFLHLVRETAGAEAERLAGRDLVVAPTRGGQHRQYLDVLSPPRAGLEGTRIWALENLDRPLTVDQLARHAAMPRRAFIRRFTEETGMPPLRWLTRQRVLAARRLLEASDWTVERIAAASGLGTATNFRTTFRRATGHLPRDYRRLHRTPDIGSG